MLQDNFLKRKKDILSKIDKSSKGHWDEKIADLCEKINSFDNYYTTSSCSGRIVLIIDQMKKGPDLFLKIYHNLVSFVELNRDLNIIAKNHKELIKFKQEPCILHVACQTFEDAKILLKKAQLAGWKKSGIIAANSKFIVELNSTEKLEFLIINQGNILVNEEFLKIIVKQANENLKKSWKKIKKLKTYEF